jgi:hypothetical protein
VAAGHGIQQDVRAIIECKSKAWRQHLYVLCHVGKERDCHTAQDVRVYVGFDLAAAENGANEVFDDSPPTSGSQTAEGS